MKAELLAALISQIGVPELARWLSLRGTDPITDEDVLVKLQIDAAKGIAAGRAWLASHPKEAREPRHLKTIDED